jgi:hypothetical protein
MQCVPYIIQKMYEKFGIRWPLMQTSPRSRAHSGPYARVRNKYSRPNARDAQKNRKDAASNNPLTSPQKSARIVRFVGHSRTYPAGSFGDQLARIFSLLEIRRRDPQTSGCARDAALWRALAIIRVTVARPPGAEWRLPNRNAKRRSWSGAAFVPAHPLKASGPSPR